MVAGRVIAETLIASVAAVILLVILGLRYINGTLSSTANAGNPFLSTVTSPSFLLVLFAIILGSMAVIEALLRARERSQRSGDRPAAG